MRYSADYSHSDCDSAVPDSAAVSAGGDMSGDFFNGWPEDGEPVPERIVMSEEQEMLDYEAHNAKVALDLNKAQQRIAKLEAALERSCTCKIYGMEPKCPACAALKEDSDE